MGHFPGMAIVALLAGTVAASPQPPARSAADLARDVQRKYEQVRDFAADFEHVYEGGVLKKKVTERGTLLVKKPGMMRWTYTSPEKKEFVSDGRQAVLSYVPEDRQVVVSAVPPSDEASSPALFLAGKGDILRDFAPSVAGVPGVGTAGGRPETGPLDAAARSTTGLSWSLDRTTLQIRQLVTTDSQGGTSTFIFSRLRENVGLPDKTFTFTIPRGVDVITDASLKR